MNDLKIDDLFVKTDVGHIKAKSAGYQKIDFQYLLKSGKAVVKIGESYYQLIPSINVRHGYY